MSQESKDPWEHMITVPQILDLYDESMKRYGGKKTEPNPNCLEACLGNAWNAECYSDTEGLQVRIVFAVHLIIYLAKNHCFADGNKRIGWLTGAHVLTRQGLRIDATQDAVVALMESIVVNNHDATAVFKWFEPRLSLR